MSEIPQVQHIYLQIMPMKVRATNREYISNYALLDAASESTLIRSNFAKRLNLKNSKIVNTSSINDSGELINVDEVELYVIDEENTSSFHIEKHWSLKRKGSICQHSFFQYISIKMENGHISKD